MGELFGRDSHKLGEGADVPSPRDFIRDDQIGYDPVTKEVTVSGLEPPVWLTTVQDTNSMDGLIDIGHHAILIGEFDRNSLIVGDVICFLNPKGGQTLHRINRIGSDEHGRWYKTKGDQTTREDNFYLRNDHIKYLLIGVIY